MIRRPLRRGMLLSDRARSAAALVMLGLLAVSMVSCGRAVMRDPDSVMVYSAGPRPLIELICRRFTEETGIRTELFAATTGQIMARLEAERFNPQADVVILASRTAAEYLKRRGWTHPLTIDIGDDTDPTWHDADGHFLATSAATVGIAFKRGLERPPVEWSDVFADPLGRPKVMPSPSRSGTSGDFVLGYALANPETIWDDFSQARQHGLEIAGANNQAITGLMLGTYDIMLGAVDYLIFRQIERGEPLVMHYPPSGVPLITRPVAVLRTAASIERAEQFVAWIFSDPMQQEISNVHLMPARRSIPLSAERQAAGSPRFLEIDDQAALELMAPTLRRFQYSVERAVIVRASPRSGS
ncbi:MAG: extracellular solute-binding protein [Phycisphaeraceae bacterium]|nr:extracellular solute-binding protein [Phycisphaeraceae bacterium]